MSQSRVAAPGLLPGIGPLLIAAAVLGACVVPQRAARVRALSELAGHLQQAYRWKDFRRVQRMLDPPLRESFTERFMPRVEPLSITDVEVSLVDIPEEEALNGIILLSLSWHPRSSVTVSTSKLRCVFHFRSKDGWVMVRQEEMGREGTGPFDVF